MTKLLSRRGLLSGAAGLTAAAALPRTAQADWRPTEAVRIIIPAAPGGTTDVMGRLLAQHLQVAWGQSTVVENKSGGGGTIAMTDFVRQKPDGHTIMVGNPGPNAIAYSIFRNITYKPDQLQPVSNMIRTSNIVSAHPSDGGEVVARTDRLFEEEPRHGELRNLRHRAEPASDRRVVPPADRTEDDACAVPRRRSRDHGGARRSGADPVRQPVSFAAAGP